MYAEFTDSPDAPGSDSHTQPEGKVNLVTNETVQPPKPPRSGSSKHEDLEAEISPSVSPSVSTPTTSVSTPTKIPVSKLTIVGVIVLIVVVAFTVANFVLVIHTRSNGYFDTRVTSSIFGMSKTTTAKLRGYCDIFYLGKCFFAIQHAEMEYIDGQKACNAKDASPANIYSKVHVMMIGAYLKRTRVGPGQFVWLGMTRDQTTGKSSFRDGSEVSFDMDWFTFGGYPKSKPEFDRIGFHFAVAFQRSEFINGEPSEKLYGVLCELEDDPLGTD